jgi:hypothetical protein
MNQNVNPASLNGERPFCLLTQAAMIIPVNLAMIRLIRPHRGRAHGFSMPKPYLLWEKVVSIRRRMRFRADPMGRALKVPG